MAIVILMPVALAAQVHHDSTHMEHHDDGAFNITETLLHHIQDTHDWHITDIPSGDGYMPIALHLPWIIYNSDKGLEVFGAHGLEAHGYHFEHEHLSYPPNASATILDFSITKTALQIMIIGVIMVILFLNISSAYSKRQGQAPKGAQSFFEPIIVFVRDDIARPNLKHKADALTPYLLTLFFFIWFSNLLGLTPFNSNIAGNISVTAALAVLSFILININGTKDYWGHIFNTPGVPIWLKVPPLPLMPVVEFIGLFTKPFALCLRLFANISAGHFMVLSLICLIFLMGKGGESTAGAFGVLPLSVIFTMIIMVLEVLVAIVQAYVFTLLTAVFIGAALEEHHHDHANDHDHH